MRRRKRDGFTILEAAVALAIIGVTAVGVLAAFGGDLRGASTTRDALTASSLAQEQLARVEILPAAALAALPDSLAYGAFAAPFDRYHFAAATRVVPGDRDLYDVSVTVEWPDGRTELRSRRFRPPSAVAFR